MSLFVYGSLQNPVLVKRLLGHAVVMALARLPGFQKKISRGHYPKIVPNKKTFVMGSILLRLTLKDIKCLDEYEGVDEGLYVRKRGTVIVRGKKMKSFYYIGDFVTFDNWQKYNKNRKKQAWK